MVAGASFSHGGALEHSQRHQSRKPRRKSLLKDNFLSFNNWIPYYKDVVLLTVSPDLTPGDLPSASFASSFT